MSSTDLSRIVLFDIDAKKFMYHCDKGELDDARMVADRFPAAVSEEKVELLALRILGLLSSFFTHLLNVENKFDQRYIETVAECVEKYFVHGYGKTLYSDCEKDKKKQILELTFPPEDLLSRLRGDRSPVSMEFKYL